MTDSFEHTQVCPAGKRGPARMPGSRGRPRPRRAVPLGLLLVLVLVPAVTSCGGEGSASRPVATGSRTAALPSRTASPPSPTRSPSRGESTVPTPAPGPTESATTSPQPSPSKSPSKSPTKPPSSSPAPTTAPPSVTESATAAPSPSSSASAAPPSQGAAETSADDGTPSWVWWLLAAAVLAAVVLAAILVPRARRRRAWDSDLATAEEDAAWFARHLLPQLQQASSADELAGGWAVSEGRVTSLEDRLTSLETTAPDESRRNRAHELRDAVRRAHRGVEELVDTRASTSIARGLSSIATELEGALDPVAPSQ